MCTYTCTLCVALWRVLELGPSGFCRSEMHLPQVWVRYGLMLEAYCRGCGKYRSELSAQVTALNKMTQVSCGCTCVCRTCMYNV